MNQLLEDVFATCAADAEIAALTADRIFLNEAPAATVLPFVIYQQVISFAGPYMLSGPNGMLTSSLQFDVYALKKSAALILATRLLVLFNGRKQTLNGRTQVLFCGIDGVGSSYDSEHKIHRSSIDLSFLHRF